MACAWPKGGRTPPEALTAAPDPAPEASLFSSLIPQKRFTLASKPGGKAKPLKQGKAKSKDLDEVSYLASLPYEGLGSLEALTALQQQQQQQQCCV